MKNYKFSIFAVLLAMIFLFAGCTKASKANLDQCNLIYENLAEKYSTDQLTGYIKIFDEDFKVDLYSEKSYNTKLFGLAVDIDAEGSKNLFNTLSENAEYSALMHGVSQLYLQWKSASYTIDIPQEKFTKLYQAIDELESTLKKLVVYKDALSTTVKNFDNVNSIAMKESLNEYLKLYFELITKFYDISTSYEDIYETVFPNQTLTVLRQGDILKFTLSSELYLAKYYYLKNIVLTDNFMTRFSFEKIYDSDTSSFIENEYFDSNFADFMEIVKQDSLIGDVEPSNVDKIFYYNVGLRKLSSLKNNLSNMEIAVDKVKNNKDANGEYAKFICDLETEINNYQSYVINNIIK